MAANNTNLPPEAISLEHTEFRIAKITFYFLILVLSCVGNSLVAVVIVGAKDMRTPPNFLILNLALCDFVTPALSIPFDFALEENKYIWSFGKAMCKVLWPFETAFSTSSSLTLAVISLERFRTLAKPFALRITCCQVLLCVLAIHIFSFSLCIPYSYILAYNVSPTSSCDEHWPNLGYGQAYTVVLCLCGYVLPLTTMSVAYILIYRSLRSNLLRLLLRDSKHQRPRNISKTSDESTLSRDTMEHQRKEQNIRLAKMFVIVVVVFAISMFPNQVLWIWIDFGNGENHRLFHYISVVCRLCTYANSVLNPFIYALKSKEFRSGFARIGRASMLPLRKISGETRKFVRKISRGAVDSQHPFLVPAQSAQIIPPVQVSDNLNGNETQEIELDKCTKDYRTEPTDNIYEMPADIPISELLLTSNLNELLSTELRETNC